MKCAIYVRVSSESQAIKGHSLEAQEKAGKNICNKSNWSSQVFREAGRSAAKDTLDNRPELRKILDLAEEKKIQYCFVTELDRLSRNPITLEFIKDVFRDNDIKVITSSATYDFSDEENEFMADLYGLFARRENKVKVRRATRAIEEGFLKGKYCWGSNTIPFGYRKNNNKELEIDPEKSKVYLKMVKLSMEGRGVHTIAKMLNSRGVLTRNSTDKKRFDWLGGTILNILRKPIYKGEFKFKDHILKYPAMISEQKWERLQKKLDSGRQDRRNFRQYFYLLSGLLYCKECNSRLIGWIKPVRGQRSYRCSLKAKKARLCNSKSINLDKVNQLVWDKSKEITLNSKKLQDAVELGNDNSFINVVEVEVEIKQLERMIIKKKDELKDLLRRRGRYKNFTDEDIDDVCMDIKKEIEELVIQKDELNSEMRKQKIISDKIESVGSNLLNISKNIESFSDVEKAEFLNLLIDKIIVSYDHERKEHNVEIIYAIPIEPAVLETTSEENPTHLYSHSKW